VRRAIGDLYYEIDGRRGARHLRRGDTSLLGVDAGSAGLQLDLPGARFARCD
jgi:hypothetical protein